MAVQKHTDPSHAASTEAKSVHLVTTLRHGDSLDCVVHMCRCDVYDHGYIVKHLRRLATHQEAQSSGKK